MGGGESDSGTESERRREGCGGGRQGGAGGYRLREEGAAREAERVSDECQRLRSDNVNCDTASIPLTPQSHHVLAGAPLQVPVSPECHQVHRTTPQRRNPSRT